MPFDTPRIVRRHFIIKTDLAASPQNDTLWPEFAEWVTAAKRGAVAYFCDNLRSETPCPVRPPIVDERNGRAVRDNECSLS